MLTTRAARLTLLVLFIITLGVTAYLFSMSERRADAESAQARAFDASARGASRALLDVRAAQRAYVAAGQSGDYWAAKVLEGLDRVRKSTAALRAEAVSPDAQTSLDAAIAMLVDFGKLDRRAVDYVRSNQRLLASDVVFADGLELGDAVDSSLEQARTKELQARDESIDTLRRRQLFALMAGTAAAVLVVLLLLPAGEAQPRATPTILDRAPARREAARAAESAGPAGLDLGDEGWSRPARAMTPPEAVTSPPVADPREASVEVVDTAPVTTADAGPAASTDFRSVASLCTDLARVSETHALPSLLDRAAALLDASGIILWIADPDGRELNPIFVQGYPPQLINRLGTIPRDAENATAAAFRTSLLQTVRADDISAGAIAAPLVTPGGCVGVMAAEVRHDSERQEAKLAAATIVAAQLAALVGPPSARNNSKSNAAAG
jgi:CHASE3 domain sensor protein